MERIPETAFNKSSCGNLGSIYSDSKRYGETLCAAFRSQAKIPVVTTDVGSVSEVVLDGVTGIITPLNVHKIADAIEELSMDKELRARLGASAQDFTLANFGVKRLVDDHEELYRRLLSNPAKS
jgi:glycosyltransferase involved in cell wall biosynthesis